MEQASYVLELWNWPAYYTQLRSYWTIITAEYHMVKNLDSGKFWRIRVWKVLTNQGWKNLTSNLNIDECLDHHVYVKAALLFIATYLQLHSEKCTCIYTYIVASWHKHKSATPFLGSCRIWASMVKATWYHITASVSLPHVPVWWYIHSQLFEVITIVSWSCTQTLTCRALSLGVLAFVHNTSNEALHISWGLAMWD